MAYIRGSGETTFPLVSLPTSLMLNRSCNTVWKVSQCKQPCGWCYSRLDLTRFEGRNVEHTKLSWEELRHHLRLSGERPGRRWLRPICRVWKKEWQTSVASFSTALPCLLIFTFVMCDVCFEIWVLRRAYHGRRTYVCIYIYRDNIYIRIHELLFEVFFYVWGVPPLVELEIRYWPDFWGDKRSLGLIHLFHILKLQLCMPNTVFGSRRLKGAFWPRLRFFLNHHCHIEIHNLGSNMRFVLVVNPRNSLVPFTQTVQKWFRPRFMSG